MDAIRLSVANEFSRTPGSRYESEGDFSGEVFRRDVLLPKVEQAIQGNSLLVVNLDGTAGYGTSFLEEAFGGLVRENNISPTTLRAILQFISTEEDYLIEDIFAYIEQAGRSN